MSSRDVGWRFHLSGVRSPFRFVAKGNRREREARTPAILFHMGGRMPQYLIERNIPGAGKLTPAELKAISQKSCGVLNKMGPQIQWVHSYVTPDQIICIYRAPNEAMVRDHARLGGFPADRVSEVQTTIDPTTAE